MEINSVFVGKTIPVTHIVKARFSPSKIAVPVKKNQYLYSNFKHVTGVPSFRDDKGLSLMKLKALDNLIERLGKLGKKPNGDFSKTSLDSKTINGLITEYARDLHGMMEQNLPYRNIGVENGLLVNMRV